MPVCLSDVAVSLYVCNVCMYVCMYVWTHIRLYVCMHVCLYVCMYVCMYLCEYVTEEGKPQLLTAVFVYFQGYLDN